MELFNLDELVAEKRKVQLFGSEYSVSDRTVGQMLNALKIAKSAETQTPEEVLNQMLETAHQIIPDCPYELIQRLNIKQLEGLIMFASESNNESEEQIDEGKSES